MISKDNGDRLFFSMSCFQNNYHKDTSSLGYITPKIDHLYQIFSFLS